jgi:hypothetical protein
MRKVFITRRISPVAKEILKGKFEVNSSDKNEPYPDYKLANIVIDHD